MKSSQPTYQTQANRFLMVIPYYPLLTFTTHRLSSQLSAVSNQLKYANDKPFTTDSHNSLFTTHY